MSLLSFGHLILSKPTRSGKHNNLSSIIRKRLSHVDSLVDDHTAKTHYSKPSKHATLANLVSAKIEDSDLEGAIRLLCSEDKPVYDSAEVYDKLIARHPSATPTRLPFKDPVLTTAVQVSEKEVLKVINSFPTGSTGGPDGLRPRHLQDLVACGPSGQELLLAITSFINIYSTDNAIPTLYQSYLVQISRL
jgi:hypothetical protein